jgi:hypothetical protein
MKNGRNRSFLQKGDINHNPAGVTGRNIARLLITGFGIAWERLSTSRPQRERLMIANRSEDQLIDSSNLAVRLIDVDGQT